MKQDSTHILICFLVFAVISFFPKSSSALIFPFNHTLSGIFENPPNASTATGNITGTYDDVTKTISFNLTFSGLVGTTTAAHFHAASGLTSNSPVRIGFIGFPTGVTNGAYANSYVLTAQQEGWLMTDSMYVNVHSNVFPGGEIRHQMYLDNPLPVELSGFTSVINSNTVTLHWITSFEQNNTGFDIERSSGKSEWTKIGFVSGSGNKTTPVNYSFTDRNLNIGSYNYRLKQIDFNGNYEYFSLLNEVNIGIPAQYSLSQNYPNPFNPSSKIDFQLPSEGNVSINLYDISGKEILQLMNEQKRAGYYTVDLNSSLLSSGIYFYTISSGNFVNTKKLMVVK
ncbi:MAG TPA: CHRD domain-containing protein [Ignavibacteria bacterium]|nr:CHRD domain-containing protein [Ignavibacteria bacterium]